MREIIGLVYITLSVIGIVNWVLYVIWVNNTNKKLMQKLKTKGLNSDDVKYYRYRAEFFHVNMFNWFRHFKKVNAYVENI